VLVRVEKNHSLTFLPINHLVTDPHTDIRPRLRHDQSKMTPDYTLVTPTMGLDVYSRRKYRKNASDRPGMESSSLPGLWATGVALVDPVTEDEEKI
jgi:hypothetical protein